MLNPFYFRHGLLKTKNNPVNLLQVKVKEEEGEWEQGVEDGEIGAEDGEIGLTDQASDQEEIEEEQYVVEKIIEKKGNSKEVLYKVKWQGYSYEECTWEPLENLADHTGTCVHLERFEQKMKFDEGLKFEKEGFDMKHKEPDYEDFNSDFSSEEKPKTKKKNYTKKKKTDEKNLNGGENEKKIRDRSGQITRAQYEKEGVQFEPAESFSCHFCGRICKSISGLRIHQEKKCAENLNKHAQCHLCNKVLNSVDEVKKHIKDEHDGEKDYEEGRCKFCNMELKNIRMRNHNKETIGIAENQIKLGKNAVSSRHQRLCLKKIMNSLKCGHCPVEAPSKEMLLEHLKSCHKVTPPPWPCLKPDCEQVCITPKARRAHMLIRHGIRLKDNRFKRIMNFACSFCLIPNSFLTEAECKEHEEQWHKFSCAEEGCNFTCHSEQLFHDHGVKMHNLKTAIRLPPPSQRPVCCDQCGKSFAGTKNLKNHLETHEIKELMCDKCDKVFTSITNLKSHIYRMHRDLSLDCQYCGQVFKSYGNLRGHVMRNHEEKKFKCEFCGKGFICKTKMNCHKKSVHSKTASYICSHGCGKAYTDPSNLRAHERTTHEGKPRIPKTDNSSDGSFIS